MNEHDGIEGYLRRHFADWPPVTEEALRRAASEEVGRAGARLLRRERRISACVGDTSFEVLEIGDPREKSTNVILRREGIHESASECLHFPSIAEALKAALDEESGESPELELRSRQTRWYLALTSPDGMPYSGTIDFSVESFRILSSRADVAFSIDYRGEDAHRSCLSLYGNTSSPARAIAEMLFLAELDGARRKVLNAD